MFFSKKDPVPLVQELSDWHNGYSAHITNTGLQASSYLLLVSRELQSTLKPTLLDAVDTELKEMSVRRKLLKKIRKAL
jgi:hypothetical protein